MNITQMLKEKLRIEGFRREFVSRQLKNLSEGDFILDNDYGSQKYHQICGNLNYRDQNFDYYQQNNPIYFLEEISA